MVQKKPAVFISYSHKDSQLNECLITHLRVLFEERDINIWDDRKIQIGEDWQKSIQDAISSASVAILLVTANFLTSKFISEEEVPKLYFPKITGNKSPRILFTIYWNPVNLWMIFLSFLPSPISIEESFGNNWE